MLDQFGPHFGPLWTPQGLKIHDFQVPQGSTSRLPGAPSTNHPRAFQDMLKQPSQTSPGRFVQACWLRGGRFWGRMPPVRSGHRASVKEAAARLWSQPSERICSSPRFTFEPTSIPLGIDSPKSPPTGCRPQGTGPPPFWVPFLAPFLEPSFLPLGAEKK